MQFNIRGPQIVSLGLLAALCFCLVPTFSVADQTPAEKAQEDQYLALAATRTKAELACRKATDVFDENKSGWDDISRAIDQAHAKAAALYQKALQAEQSKADADRIQSVIDDLNAQAQQLEQDANDGSAQRDKLAAAYRDAGTKAQNAYQVFQNLVSLEQGWKNADMDLTLLNSNYELVTKTVNDAIAQGQQTLDALRDLKSRWDDKVTAAAKATGLKP